MNSRTFSSSANIFEPRISKFSNFSASSSDQRSFSAYTNDLYEFFIPAFDCIYFECNAPASVVVVDNKKRVKHFVTLCYIFSLIVSEFNINKLVQNIFSSPTFCKYINFSVQLLCQSPA